VRVLDAIDLRTLAETAVGPGLYALAALPEASHVFVALSGRDTVVMLDASGGLLTTTTPGRSGLSAGIGG
jgi:DNA-binding beta-propeller fold protein YncE